MIPLNKLITLAPFSAAMQQKLLVELPNLSEGKQLELTQLCWDLIGTKYEQDLQNMQEDAFLDMALGEKKYTEEDFQHMVDTYAEQTAEKLQAAGEQGNLDNARTELAQIVKKSPKKKVAAKN